MIITKKTSALLIFLFVFRIVLSQNQLSGIITVQETGDPLAGATVYIPELSKGIVSDKKGYYKLENLPAGTFTVEYSFMGFRTIVVKITLNEAFFTQNVSLYSTVIQTHEVVVSSSSYTTQHENAVKIETLKADQILLSGHPNIIGSIAEIAGIDMITKGNGISKPVIRGLSNSNVVVLNNGVKLENYQFSEDHPFLVDEFGVGQVEVIKGPASLLYGSDAVGGIINIVPEKPAPSGYVQGEITNQYFTNSRGVTSSMGIKGTGNKIN